MSAMRIGKLLSKLIETTTGLLQLTITDYERNLHDGRFGFIPMQQEAVFDNC